MELITIAALSDITEICNLDCTVIGNKSRRDYIKGAISKERCIISRNSTSINGFLIFDTIFFDNSFISLVIVSPYARRKGIASSLINYFESISPTKKIFSSTNQSNYPMQKVFKANQYLKSGYIENLDEGDPEIIYYKHI